MYWMKEILHWQREGETLTYTVPVVDDPTFPEVPEERVIVGGNTVRYGKEPRNQDNGLFTQSADGTMWFHPMTRREVDGTIQDALDEARNRALDPARRWEPRLFTSLIFYGNGDAYIPQEKELYRQVQSVLNMNGGLQQPPMSTDPEPTDEDRAYEQSLVDKRDAMIRSIVIAMMGDHLLKEPT
jgi:hypothetical protein